MADFVFLLNENIQFSYQDLNKWTNEKSKKWIMFFMGHDWTGLDLDSCCFLLFLSFRFEFWIIRCHWFMECAYIDTHRALRKFISCLCLFSHWSLLLRFVVRWYLELPFLMFSWSCAVSAGILWKFVLEFLLCGFP